MKKIIVAAWMVSLFDVGVALAQTQKTATPPAQVQYKQLTRYDFDNEQVEGKTLHPDGDYVDGVRKGRPSSLVKTRQNFIPEMYKSTERL